MMTSRWAPPSLSRRIPPLGLSAGLAVAVFALLGFGLLGSPLAFAATFDLYVDGASGTDAGDCQNPGAPCQTIGYATGQAGSGDTILVTAGTYTGTTGILGPLTLRGGYVRSGAEWTANGGTTILDGAGTNFPTVMVTMAGGPVTLEYLTITGGKSVMAGGVAIIDTPVLIDHCVIHDNVADGNDVGAGVWGTGTEFLTIQNTFIISNDIQSPNPPGSTGGAGGVRVDSVPLMLINTLISGNNGDAAIHANGDLYLQNVTIADNVADIIYNPAVTGTLAVTNTVVFSHAQHFTNSCPAGSTCQVTYSDWEGWTGGGTGNIDADPLFIDSTYGAYSLRASSPARDAGTAVGAPTTDIVGTSRGTLPDMGAYEWRGVALPAVLRQ